MVRKGRFNISILVTEAKIQATKDKIVTALATLKSNTDIESASWNLQYEEIPESGTI